MLTILPSRPLLYIDSTGTKIDYYSSKGGEYCNHYCLYVWLCVCVHKSKNKNIHQIKVTFSGNMESSGCSVFRKDEVNLDQGSRILQYFSLTFAP